MVQLPLSPYFHSENFKRKFVWDKRSYSSFVHCSTFRFAKYTGYLDLVKWKKIIVLIKRAVSYMQVYKIYIFILAFFLNVGVEDSDKRISKEIFNFTRATSWDSFKTNYVTFQRRFLVHIFCDENIFWTKDWMFINVFGFFSSLTSS